MINFTRAFDTAWERMHIILFRPFDFGKWCAIGLSAFLAGLLQGGNGFNSSFNTNTNNFNNNVSTSASNGGPVPKLDWNSLSSTYNHAVAGMAIGLVVLIALAIVVFVFALIFLMYWLGARGQFMFLDNIVRNRGAIAWPWNYYERQANSVFALYLIFMVISFAIIIPIIVVIVLMCIPLFQQHRWPGEVEIAGFVALGLAYFGFAFVMFIFREFGIPLMFRQGLLARPALWESLRLIQQNPGSIAVFVLLRLAIFLAVAILSVIICCATCCIGMLPYVGTVMLLPVLIYVRCFTLDCLAQFGPRYDVWTVDVPPVNPPLPPG
jgi:hypothetical protein